MRVSSIEEAGELADIIVAQLNLKLEDKQRILELNDPSKRLEELLSLMTGEIEILEVEKKIRGRVKSKWSARKRVLSQRADASHTEGTW